MNGDEIAAMLYQTNPDPLHDFIFSPGDYGFVEMDATFHHGMAEACKNLNDNGECAAKFVKRSDELVDDYDPDTDDEPIEDVENALDKDEQEQDLLKDTNGPTHLR